MDPDHETGKICLGEGMHCPSASNVSCVVFHCLQDVPKSGPCHWCLGDRNGMWLVEKTCAAYPQRISSGTVG